MCECQVCKRYREFLNQLESVPEANKEFFRELYSEFVEVCMDRDYYEAIVKNQWPTADEIIASYRKKETPLVVRGPVPEFKRNFEVGKTYRRADGRLVKIIAEDNVNSPEYCVVQGDDGDKSRSDGVNGVIYERFFGPTFGWRYDRPKDSGRVTGSDFDMSHPHTLIPGEVTEAEMMHIQV